MWSVSHHRLFMTSKEKYNLCVVFCMNRASLDRESLYRVSGTSTTPGWILLERKSVASMET